jgi:threonine/homoserine/homoserine lactone efflux protein
MSTFWNSATAVVAGTLTLRMGARASSSSRLKTWLERVIGVAFIGLRVKLALSKQ